MNTGIVIGVTVLAICIFWWISRKTYDESYATNGGKTGGGKTGGGKTGGGKTGGVQKAKLMPLYGWNPKANPAEAAKQVNFCKQHKGTLKNYGDTVTLCQGARW